MNSKQWIYRSDSTGRRLRLEPLPEATEFSRADFSAELSQHLLTTVSQQVKQPPENLQILQVQSATWDGCLGLANPDEVCAQIAIAGFRVLIADGPREWVYHLDSAGTQIVQNAIASDTRGRLVTYFDSPRANASALDAEVVFQVRVSSFASNSEDTITLPPMASRPGICFYGVSADLYSSG